MKIAAGTLDQVHINPDHFGSSRFFLIAEIEGGKITKLGFRENPYNGHGIPGKGMKIAGLLSDCQGILIRSIGSHAFQHMPERGLDIYLTRAEGLDDALIALAAGKVKKFDPDIGKFRAMEAADALG